MIIYHFKNNLSLCSLLMQNILEISIANLPFNDELKNKLQSSGFNNLQELISEKFAYHRKHNRFTFDDELTLFGFFQQNGLEEFWNE